MSQSVDDLFTALADRYRRRLLMILLERDQKAELDIPEAIMTRGDEGGTLHAKLVHSHLPKLEEFGFIEWDREADVVTRGPRFDDCRPYLRAIYDHRDKLPTGWYSEEG